MPANKCRGKNKVGKSSLCNHSWSIWFTTGWKLAGEQNTYSLGGLSPPRPLISQGKKPLLQQSPGRRHLNQVTIIGDITCQGGNCCQAPPGVSCGWSTTLPLLGSLPIMQNLDQSMEKQWTNTNEGMSHKTEGQCSSHVRVLNDREGLWNPPRIKQLERYDIWMHCVWCRIGSWVEGKKKIAVKASSGNLNIDSSSVFRFFVAAFNLVIGLDYVREYLILEDTHFERKGS